MTMLSRTALAASRSVAARAGARRSMSDTPKMHRAKDVWKDLEATRPHDHHPHNVFEPPYDPLKSGIAVLTVLALGYGTMFYGMAHQQYKQGYWK